MFNLVLISSILTPVAFVITAFLLNPLFGLFVLSYYVAIRKLATPDSPNTTVATPRNRYLSV